MNEVGQPCIKCRTILGTAAGPSEKPQIHSTAEGGAPSRRRCPECGEILDNPRSKFCPNCGARQDSAPQNPADHVSGSSKPAGKPEKTKKKIAPVLAVLFLLVGAGIAAWWFLFSSVEEVTVDPESLELIEGETVTIECVFSPKWAFPKNAEWMSSNESVATVDETGKVTAIKKGLCAIIYTADGMTSGCHITVKKDGIDLAEVYKAIGGEGYYCKLARDESYLMIDTNPEDEEYYLKESVGAQYVIKANMELNLPEAVTTKMGQTRALDGRQTETYEDIEVSWTYHPDTGLEVLYEVR